MRSLCLFFIIAMTSGKLHSQCLVKGKITSGGEPLPSATIISNNSSKSTVSNADGFYSMILGKGQHELIFSFSGYIDHKASLFIADQDSVVLNIVLEPQKSNLEIINIVGSRSLPRTKLFSSMPIDVFSGSSLASTGQPSLDKQLQYRLPSFNSINVPVRDATTFFDPYELRNLGPSRTLILINGKRKNPSSLLYVQFAPGRGETGVDISTIPVDAIKRVEVLRDGASAQYGTDAIAGVINIILKDKTEYNTLTFNAGITSKGDGGSYGFSYNGGITGEKSGFVNYSIDIGQQSNAVRSGIIDRKVEKLFFGGTPKKDAGIDAFLDLYPTARNTNGTGDNSTAKFNINFANPIAETAVIYGNAGIVSRKALSNANYRTPYWRTDAGLLHTRIPGAPNYTGLDDPLYEGYLGYVPTFEGDLTDYQLTLGIKTEVQKWTHDLSFTSGGNRQDYTVENTVNRSLGTQSPTFFKPGGFGFSHIVGNYDMNRELNSFISIALGAEVRSENYTVVAGDTASYSGEGANSFPGMRSENASISSRFNMGIYADASLNITPDLLVNTAVRGEKYSDFGNAFVWKIAGRQKLADDKFILRGSVSTGFRAPTLHQIYTQSTVLSYVNNNIELTGLFNNRSKQAFLLGIPRLKPEQSLNITGGLGFKPDNKWEISLDFYSIRLNDRIYYSSGIASKSPSTPLGQVLKNAGVVQAQFFLNGLETQTSGLDFVINYLKFKTTSRSFNFHLAGNIQLKNEIIGNPKEPLLIKNEGVTSLTPTIRLLFTDSRPKYKIVESTEFNYKKYSFSVNNILFGPTKYQDIDAGGPNMLNIQQVFKPAILTDLMIKYNFNKKIVMTITVNNLLNKIPKWTLVGINPVGEKYLSSNENMELQKGLVTFGGRYRILGASGSQFSQLGTMFQSNLVFKF